MRAALPFVAVLVGVAACACGSWPSPAAAPTVPPPSAARFDAFVLGIAQDGGLPHLGCDAACCAEARRTGRQVHPACLGVHDPDTGRLLLSEATPAIETQVALLQRLAGRGGRGRAPVDAILLTHAHVGHYQGLALLGREVAAAPGIDTWVTPRMAAFLRANAPWSQLVERGHVRLRVIEPGRAFAPLDGLSVTATPVPHRDELSDTVAYTLRGPAGAVLFAPDVDRWERTGALPGHLPERLLEGLLEGVDVAYLDGTFYDGRELPDRDLSEVPHPSMVDTIERLAARARDRPGRLRFIHLNHTNPALHQADIRRALARAGFGVAEVGERVDLD